MARRGQGGRRSSGGRKKKQESDFIRLTGLFKPERGKKHMGQGLLKTEDIEDLLEAVEAKGGDGAFLYLFRNDDEDMGDRDPSYVLSALPLKPRDDDDDEDERPRRKKKRRPEPTKKKRRRPRDEDEDEGDEDDGYEADDDDNEEDPPF